MSKRKTKVIAFNISAGTFKSFEETVKEANAIKIWLTRLCNKKGYSCKAIIGISKHNPKTGSITTQKTGGKGRPITIFERKSKLMIPTTTEPHIHIVLYANPADMITSLLAKHLNNKYKHKVCWFNDCSEYIYEAVDYVIRQSLKLRKVEIDNDNILAKDELGFYSAINQANIHAKCERIAFTYNEPPKEPETPYTTETLEAIKKQKTLQYNSYINIYTSKLFILYIYVYILNKRRYKLGINIIYKVSIHIRLRYIPP